MPRNVKSLPTLRQDATRIFEAGLKAVDPVAAVMRYLNRDGDRLLIDGTEIDLNQIQNVFVIGAGKAAGAMAVAVESALLDRITDGIVTVKYNHLAPVKQIRLVEAAHPVPDLNGCKNAADILSLAQKAGANDLVICVISGGGSALLPLPAKGISLDDKQETTRVLLACGATIHEINTIRKHTSAIKGGQLAKAVQPARLFTFMLSDVVGDDLDVIASGPTVPDSSTFADCMSIFEKYDILNALPETVVSHIQAGLGGSIGETPKPGDSAFVHTANRVIGSNFEAIMSAKQKAEALGYQPLVLSTMIEGETRDAAIFHAAIAKEVLKTGHPIASPACILSGGETTVTICGGGKGGRNQEFALAAALKIAELDNLVIFSAGTDGTDGPTDAAGAVVDSRTVSRARSKGLSPKAYLRRNDSYHFFKQLDDLIITGPTNTNVMDMRIMLC